VLGSVAGLLGALSSLLALQPDRLGRLHLIDGLSLGFHTVTVHKAPDCRACSPFARSRLQLVDPEVQRCPAH
jgi:hypothetical protein